MSTSNKNNGAYKYRRGKTRKVNGANRKTLGHSHGDPQSKDISTVSRNELKVWEDFI